MKLTLIPVVFLLIIAPFSSNADTFDYSVINGEWGAYEDNLIKRDWYTYLKIDEDGGNYTYSYGTGPIQFEFAGSQMTRINGLLLIRLRPDSKRPMRLVISAFRTERGSALLTGSLYMFKTDNGVESLFNTIPQRMEDLTKNREVAIKIKTAIEAGR